MAHKYEHVSTGGGFSVLNNGTKTTVIAQDGTISVTDITLTGDLVIGDNAADTVTMNSLTTLTTTQKIQFRDTGLYINSSADGQLDIVADTTVAISGAVTMDSTLTMTGKINLGLNGGAASASGLLMGVGTTANPATTSTADAKFVEIRAETTATSGDNRLMYLRYSLNGTTGGECVRAFTKLEAAGTTVRGAHISLDVASGGSASGLGVGVDNQILVHDGALTGGTYAVTNIEAYSSGTSTDISGVTDFSFIRCVLGGDTTGAANVDDNANLITLSGGSIAAGNIVETDTDETKFSHKLRINAYGTTLYLMATAT